MHRCVRLGLSLAFALGLAACATRPPMQFYALNPQPGGAGVDAAMADLVLALGPVDLPEYLRRPQIVTRPGDNRLAVDEFNRWGGALEEEITRVLAQRLGDTLGTVRVYGYPSRVVPDTDLRVAVSFRTFDGTLGGEVVLDAAWSIIDERTAAVVLTRQSRHRTTAAGPGYDAYASALSELLGALGTDLAAALGSAAAQLRR